MSEKRIGDWMQTYSGRQFWPLDPRPEEVCIEDIAHALSLICRFNGHCERFYSVAEHSVLVSLVVPKEIALWALLHDASEAYIADIIRPAKRFITGYAELEEKIMASVCARFGLPAKMPPAVKRADNAVLADEARSIMKNSASAWALPEPPAGTCPTGLLPHKAEEFFLARYYDLAGANQ